jgi:hypothetical protein
VDNTTKKEAEDGSQVSTTTTEDGFRVLIDESFFSLVFADGCYVADVFVPADMHPIDQEARMLDVLRRARELGLTCIANHPNPSGWVSLQFYLTEDDIDRNF